MTRVNCGRRGSGGMVLIVAVIVAFLVEIVRGHDGSPYTWLGALAGVAYVAAVTILRWRG